MTSEMRYDPYAITSADDFWSVSPLTLPGAYNAGTHWKARLNLDVTEVGWLNSVYNEFENPGRRTSYVASILRLYLLLIGDFERGRFTERKDVRRYLIQLGLSIIKEDYIEQPEWRRHGISAARCSIANCLMEFAKTRIHGVIYKRPLGVPKTSLTGLGGVIDWDGVSLRANEHVKTLPALDLNCWEDIFYDKPQLWKAYWLELDLTDIESYEFFWSKNRRNKFLPKIFFDSAIQLAMHGLTKDALVAYAMHLVSCKSQIYAKPKPLPQSIKASVFSNHWNYKCYLKLCTSFSEHQKLPYVKSRIEYLIAHPIDEGDYRKREKERSQALSRNDHFWSEGHSESYDSYRRGVGDKYRHLWHLSDSQVRWLNLKEDYWYLDGPLNCDLVKEHICRVYLKLCEHVETGRCTQQVNYQEFFSKLAISKLDKRARKNQRRRDQAILEVRGDLWWTLFSVAERAVVDFYLRRDWENPWALDRTKYLRLNVETLKKVALEEARSLPPPPSNMIHALFQARPTIWKRYWDTKPTTSLKESVLQMWSYAEGSKFSHLVFYRSSEAFAKAGDLQNGTYAHLLYVLECHVKGIRPKPAISALRRAPKWKAVLVAGLVVVEGSESTDKSLIAGKLHEMVWPPPVRIAIDAGVLKKVNEAHETTVASLSEVLDDAEEKAPPQTRLLPKASATDNVIRQLIRKDFSMQVDEFTAIAKEYSCMPNKLLDEINGRFVEVTGEPIVRQSDGCIRVLRDYTELLKSSLTHEPN